MNKTLAAAMILFLCWASLLEARIDEPPNAAELKLALDKIATLGSVLYIAAHPDDENTGLMAYLSKEKHLRTAYLSLTRGDGGQNLIGPEQGSEIGIIRSQELLEARRFDGGEQLFTRAVDFGYAKSVAESMKIWGRDEILGDIVWIIRYFRPDVIITRFSADEDSNGHGHHPAATILALDAFKAAADPGRYPDQLKKVPVWQAKRILWNKWRPKPEEQAGLIKVDLGTFNPHLGMSYNEIAARSRSMHKSQGFGSLPNRGSQIDYFEHLDGIRAETDLFDGIDTTWSRVMGGKAIDTKLTSLSDFDMAKPWLSLAKLLDLDMALAKLGSDPWVVWKRKELNTLIKACAGLFIEPLVTDYVAAPGDTLDLSLHLVQRSHAPMTIKTLRVSAPGHSPVENQELSHNRLVKIDFKLTLPADFPISQPYWLEKSPQGRFFDFDPSLLELAQNPPALRVDLTLTILGRDITFSSPVRYRWADRVKGEMQRPFEVRPPVTATFQIKNLIFADPHEKEVLVRLKGHASAARGQVRLQVPEGWQVTPKAIAFDFTRRHDERMLAFHIRPPERLSRGQAYAWVDLPGKTYRLALSEIVHDHIEPQVYFPESSLRLLRLDARVKPLRIGYIEGSGDEIPQILTDMGYAVDILSDEALSFEQLKNYGTVIAGIRAHNTRERLKFAYPDLMKFVEAGGTYIVQYNVAYGLLTEEIGPYPFKIGRARIADETAPFRVLKPDNPLFKSPNMIGSADFADWVQERGLYFAESWDERYEALLAGNDPGEAELTGSTLVATYGKGRFIYTGLSWFRQLPAGVPGACRLFINMIEAGLHDR
jgi:LmbE family N-acetylglucosaminyl deacetylase